MPVKLYQVRDDKVEEVKKDNRTKLLNGDTGDTLDAFQMKKALVTDYLMGKGGYCYIRKDRNKVTGLFYVEDMYVSIMRLPEPIFKDYQILIMGKSYKPYEFVKLLRNTKDGASGTGLTEEISKELETAYQTLLYQLGMVKSGGNKRGFLKADKKLGQDEIDVLKTAWRNMYGNNTESVVVLNNGLQFQEASSSSVEMQMNESKRTLADEINGLFHIYPNDFERTFKEAIYPVVKCFETALNRDLLLEREKSDHYFEFDVKEIVKASLNERYSAYKTAKETGFLTINEIRKAENLNWIDGLDVVNVGLGAVLYDIDEKKFFTPNTGEATDIESATQKKTEDMIVAHEETEAFDESGNSAERELRYNENHDAKTGKFAPKSGGGLSGMAREQSWEQFRGNLNNRDMVALMKENGIMSPRALREYWVQQRQEAFSESDAKEVSKEEAIQTVRENVPQNVLDGWFRDANSKYKEQLETLILENKEVRNAGLNIAYANAKDGGTQQDFKTFINTEQTMYRGDRGQSAIDADVFMSYTPDRKVAQSFGKNITEKKVRPIDTYGSYQTTAEYEYLLPVVKPRAEDRELRYNENHDAKTGKFTSGKSGGGSVSLKQQQLEIIQKTNPMTDDYHVGIRTVNDIKSAREAFETQVDEDEDYVYPDFTQADGMKALETGKITIYSSKPIANGVFVSPSRMMANDYAGGGRVYSETVGIDDVAWINSGEGQFAKLTVQKPKREAK